MQGIKLAVHDIGARRDVSLISVSGYVDTTTCQDLSATLRDLIQKQRLLIIVDLSAVEYISSAGWGVFMGEIKNIRELGGDLKIVAMPAEVFEVFEMLEFNRILTSYDCIEEAVDEFDILRGINITTESEQGETVPRQIRQEPRIELTPVAGGKMPIPERISRNELPLAEKIKRIVLEDPLLNAGAIRKRLRSEDYGKARIGIFKIRRLLRQMNLDTRDKRYRFYRSR